MPQQPVPHHVEDEQASLPSSRRQTRQPRSWLAGLVARDPRLYVIYVEVRTELPLDSLAALLVGVAIALLPDALTVGPPWLLLAITAVVVVPLFYTLLFRSLPHRLVRSIRFGLQMVLTLALLGSIT